MSQNGERGMDARKWGLLLCGALLVVAASEAAAQPGGRRLYSARSQNFLVSTVDPEFAQQLVEHAEKMRRELAIEWLGRELPPLPQPIALTADQVGPQTLASGVTEFGFRAATPYGIRMVVAGTKERILDSVLPHEILHTVLATHFGRPVIRWADEGCCTTVEHASERAKQDKLLIEFLHTGRGIAFNKMFRMEDYPHDLLPLYSQGYSLCRFLLAQGGKRKFLEYIGQGMATERWDDVTRQFYGYQDLSDLQVTWLEWVRQGSPEDVATRGGAAGEEALTLANVTPPPVNPARLQNGSKAPSRNLTEIAGASYYEQRAKTSPMQDLAKPKAGETRTSVAPPTARTTARPFEAQTVKPRALQWGEGMSSRPATQTKSLPSTPRPGASSSPSNYRQTVQSVTNWAAADDNRRR